jgi:hypothetical protein
MKNGKPEHYWRIHARVARRILTDLPEIVRHGIAHDDSHTSEDYKWFAKKVNEDTERLFQDGTYYDNCEFTFRIAKGESVRRK